MIWRSCSAARRPLAENILSECHASLSLSESTCDEVLYAQHFTVNRGAHVEARADRGLPRPRSGKIQTEAGFLRKRRRCAASALATAAGTGGGGAGADSTTTTTSSTSTEDDSLDEKQQKLLKKQRLKARQKKVQCLMDGGLVGDEASTDLEADAAEELVKRRARACGRSRKTLKVAAVRKTDGADLVPHFTGASCWIDECDMGDIWKNVSARGCSRAPTRQAAAVFVVDDPNAPGQRAYWHAILRGAFLATPEAFLSNGQVRGPVVKYVPANATKRIVHITAAFAAKHKEIVTIMAASCASWTFLRDLQDRGPPDTQRRLQYHINNKRTLGGG